MKKINALKPLVMMQLKDKIDMSFLQSKKKTIMKVTLSILAFALVTAFVFVLLMLSKKFHFFSLLDMVPITVITLIFTIMLIMSIISATFGLMKTMYFAKDNQVLVTMPVTATQIFFSKLIVFYVYEIKKSFTFLIPLFISYGLLNGFSLLYYPWLLFCFLFVSLIPVVVGALLSIPLMGITLILRKYKALQLTLFAIVLVGAFFGILQIISMIPANINIVGSWGTLFWEISDFLTAWQKTFNLFYQIVYMVSGSYVGLMHILLTGKTFVIMLVLIIVEIVCLAAAYFCVKPLFFKMTSSPFEYRKTIVKRKIKNRKAHPVLSGIKAEFVMNLRESSLLYNTFVMFAMLPISVLLLNKIYAAMNTRLAGQQMAIVFNILIILVVLLSTNYVFASIYSKEGNSIYIVKTSPTGYFKLLVPKLIFNMFVSILSLIVTFIIYGNMTSMPTTQILLFFFSVLFVYIAHALWSAELDFMNPQNRQYATTGSNVSNPNEAKSTAIGFAIAFAFAAITFLLFMEGVMLAWIKMFVISLIFVICRIYLYVARVKLYYKEIEVN